MNDTILSSYANLNNSVKAFSNNSVTLNNGSQLKNPDISGALYTLRTSCYKLHYVVYTIQQYIKNKQNCNFKWSICIENVPSQQTNFNNNEQQVPPPRDSRRVRQFKLYNLAQFKIRPHKLLVDRCSGTVNDIVRRLTVQLQKEILTQNDNVSYLV